MSRIADKPNARWWALAVLAMTQLVVVLDTMIVTIALPQAQVDLGMSDSLRQWVVTAYALAFGALLLLGGRIADYWGRKRTFMVGMIGFGAASLWAGLAQSGMELVIARGVQGAFAALLAPAALAMLTVTFAHGKERNLAFAVFGTVAGSGAAIGLILGGVLTEFTDWRWCLFVNLIFVAFGLVGGALVLRESKAEGDNRYDVWGTVAVTLGLGAIVYGFTRAEHGWGAIDTVAFLALGIVLLTVFVLIERTVDQPLLPLRVILRRVRGGAILIQAANGAVMIGAILYLAFYFQIVLGMGPLMAGLANLAMTVAIMAFSPVTTKILNTFGPRPLMIVGPLVSAAGLFLLLGITPDGNYFLQVLPALVVLGIGLSMLFVPVQNLALLGVENEDAGVASAVVNSVFHIGGSIGLAVFTVFYASTADSAIASGTAELTAFTDGYKAVFLAAAVTMVAASLTGFLLIRGKKEDLNPAWDEAEAALVH
ncbi:MULTISPECIES: MFS transporter [unclassified Rathayibacter]|uniref:MFS transporter n=1 Tax=unclassified Rathayibacter TaxID=2609250 RepID=UPI000CE7D7B7|nr:MULTISPECIES: MFS transporter [unclassified Rathayibacter]PPF53347.1 MFS transporter [Rathayibacter sp. AY1C2]PPG60364.1 MFS transporter [Rathayibacter sp. AY1C7]PPH53595.1 MFS transporter [Rathayibacter sp. AY1E1]PPH87773.1 MFS transporter [Rathayibacter sp. AY1D5]